MYNNKTIYEVIEYLYKQDKKELAEQVIKVVEETKLLQGQLQEIYAQKQPTIIPVDKV